MSNQLIDATSTDADLTTEAPLGSFEKDLITGNVKKLMAELKAEFVTNVPAANQTKGAGSSADLWKVPPQALRVMPGFNVRLPGPNLKAHIRDLADSMKREGYYQDKPISAIVLVDEDGQQRLYVTDGHCRLQAALLAIREGAPIKVVPVVTEEGRTTTLEDLTVKLYRGNTGKELPPFETGLVCHRLSRAGWPDAVIAERLGIKVQYVGGLLRLVTAPKALRDAVTSDEMAASEAISLLRKHGARGALEELTRMRAKAAAEAAAKQTDGDEEAPAKLVRLTARHASDANMKKAVKKYGSELYHAARQVKADPAYASLRDETRTLLESLMARLEAAEAADKRLPTTAQSDAVESTPKTELAA